MRIIKYFVISTLAICMIFTILLLGLIIFSKSEASGGEIVINGNSLNSPWITEADENRPKNAPVIGNLGGKSVTIPAGVARHVEYDGDPGWGERRDGAIPSRSNASVLRSFGFDMRFPGMEDTSSGEMRKDKRSFTIYDTPWVRVGVTAGSYFGDGYFFERVYSDILKNVEKGSLKKSDEQYGLEFYEPTDKSDPGYYKYYYFSKNRDGNINVYINCHVKNHAAASCQQMFFMEDMEKVKISITYRIGMLSDWSDLKRLASKRVIKFKSIED